jgi:hypothetical protein
VFLLRLLGDTPAKVDCLEARAALGAELLKFRKHPLL